MKKTLLFAACAVILLGWMISVNAKESSAGIRQLSTARPSQKTCDFDNNWKVNIWDVTRFIDYCQLTQNGGARCDMNWNKKADISDIVKFQEVCINMLLNQSNSGKQAKTTRANQTKVKTISKIKRNRK